MSRKINKQDPKLKALLDQEKNRKQSEDPFEKEALEGFALLESGQEAFGLKESLDLRMEQVFAPVKSAPYRSYWLAAAGLALAVGISAYFILSSNAVVDQKLAMAVLEPMADSVSPAAEQSYEAKAAEFKSAEPAPTAAASQAQRTEKADEAPAAPGLSNRRQENKDVAPPPPEKNQERLALSSTNSSAAAPQMSKAEDNLDEREAILEEKKSEVLSKMSVSPARAKKKAAADAEAAKPAADFASMSDAAPVMQQADSLHCSYEGGEAALQRDLSERLIAKELNRHFIARLTIGANGRILKVDFLKADGISTADQNEISSVVESLDKFKFGRKPGRNEVCEYKIVR